MPTPEPVSGTLPYSEATELHECIRIMGEAGARYCRQEILGFVEESATSRSIRVGDVTVVLLPDGNLASDSKRSAGTRAEVKYITPMYKTSKVRGPRNIQIFIQTSYKIGADPTGLSQYGRGTTPEDIAAGNTSLAFHEQCHREAFVRYVREHRFPRFSGRRRMPIEQFRNASEEWIDAVKAYMTAMDGYSTAVTDCVGKTIDEFDGTVGTRRAVCGVKSRPGGNP